MAPQPGDGAAVGSGAVPERLDALCADWLQRIASGADEAALGALYDATHARCHAVALRITRQREAAEDVVAATYLRIWQRAGQFDPARGPALGWLLAICRNQALDSLRRRDPAATHPDPEALLDVEPAADGDPADLVAALQEGSRVREAIAALPAVAQRLLGLAFDRGLTHQEIASLEGLPLGTVKTHLRRAQAAVRRAVTGSQGESVPEAGP
ncbi:MAG: RNA polymerase sigma factor [Gammaproteobacteria bacterium]